MSHLPLEHIAASLFSHWADQFPLAVTTIYPGMRIDTTTLAEWLEIGIDEWTDQPAAGEDPPTTEFLVVAHVFIRPGLARSRGYELVDAARQTLAGQTITIYDFETTGTPTVGSAAMQDAEVRDASRADADFGAHAMQHLVVRVVGIAEADVG